MQPAGGDHVSNVSAIWWHWQVLTHRRPQIKCYLYKTAWYFVRLWKESKASDRACSCHRSFVKATYDLEGDRPLVVEWFDTIETVKVAIQTFHTPNLNAIVKNLSESSDNVLLHSVFQLTQNPNSSSRVPHLSSRAFHSSLRAADDNNALQQGVTQYAKDCVQPGFDYTVKFGCSCSTPKYHEKM